MEKPPGARCEFASQVQQKDLHEQIYRSCLFKGPKWTDRVANDQVKQGHIKNSWLANVTPRPKEDKGCWSVVNQPRDTGDPRLTSAVRRTPSILQPGASVVKFPHERLILANELDAWDPDWVLLRNEGFSFYLSKFFCSCWGWGRDGDDYATHTHTHLILHTQYAHVSWWGCTQNTDTENNIGKCLWVSERVFGWLCSTLTSFE